MVDLRCKHDLLIGTCAMCNGSVNAGNQTREYGNTGFANEDENPKSGPSKYKKDIQTETHVQGMHDVEALDLDIRVNKESREEVESMGNDNHKKCLIEGCENPAKTRGLCKPDYQRWYQGTISHPKLGKWKAEVEKQTRKETPESEKSNTYPNSNTLLSMLREFLDKADAFARVLKIMGYEKEVKAEMSILSRWR